MKKLKRFIKRLFCRHEFGWYTKNSYFSSISGETRYLRCPKCEKVKATMFAEYEGNGFK